MKPSDGERTARYRDLFADGQFSALFVADVLSKTGGQLGRFALIALVYDRTDSPALAALTVAVIYLPGLTGGPILATLADRLPRRRLLIACDLLRSPLIAAIAVATYAELPFAVPAALLILLMVGLLDAPFGAARQAILADILLDKDQFALGNSLVGASQQVVQVIGFGVGGVVVTAVGPEPTLAIHACAYLVSAVVLASFVRRRPAPAHDDDGRPHLLRDAFAGFKVVRDTARLPPLFWLLLIGPAVMITAEALAVPLAKELGITGMLRGVLMAAIPLGTAVGLTLTGRLSTQARERLLLPFSIGVGVAILISGLLEPAYVVALCFFLAGVAMGHIAHLQFLIVSLVDTNVRGRVIGFAQMMLQVAQCVAAVLSGTVAQATSIQFVLVASGVAGIILVLIGAALHSPFGGKHRASPRRARQEPSAPSPALERQFERQLDQDDPLRIAESTAALAPPAPRRHPVEPHRVPVERTAPVPASTGDVATEHLAPPMTSQPSAPANGAGTPSHSDTTSPAARHGEPHPDSFEPEWSDGSTASAAQQVPHGATPHSPVSPPADARGRHLYVAGGGQSPHRFEQQRPLVDDDEPLPWETTAQEPPDPNGHLGTSPRPATAQRSQLRRLG